MLDYPGALELAVSRLRRVPAALADGVVVLLPADIQLQGLERQLLEALVKEDFCDWRSISLPFGREDNIQNQSEPAPMAGLAGGRASTGQRRHRRDQPGDRRDQ